MEKKEVLFLSIIMVVVFLGQLYIADRTIFGDDHIFATFAQTKQFFYTENAHPPLPVWLDIFFTSFFGLGNRALRLTSLLFATLTVGLVYFLAKKTVGQKAAWIAALLVAFSAWHIRASQMNSGSDGGMFTFFFYLTLYFFVLFLEAKQTKHLVFLGISFGLTLLSKETGVLLLPICVFYYFHTLTLKTKKETTLKEEISHVTKCSLAILFIAGIVWSIFPILDILYNNGQNMNAIIERVNSAVIQREEALALNYLFLSLFSIFKVLLWMGPLFLFLPFLLLFTKNEQKQYFLFFLVLIVSLLFYIIVTPPNLDRTRYLMILIPALAILSANYLVTKIEADGFGKREWFFVGFGTVFVFVAFLLINQHIVVVSYESQQNPIALLKQGNVLFSIPVFTETDNSGFLLHFGIFLITYTITVFCCLFFFSKNKLVATIALILFLSISLGYNFLVTEEYGLHWTSPNYSDAVKELITYAEENQLKEPLYILKNYELHYYLRPRYTTFVSTYGISETDEGMILEFKQQLEQHGGTILFTDMPPIDKEGLLWKMITEKCVADLTAIDNGIEIGWMWMC